MTDIDESLDKYYDDSDEGESKNKIDQSDESDVSVKAMKRKLEALKNEMDPQEAERKYQEDLKIGRQKKAEIEKQKEAKKKEDEDKKKQEQLKKEQAKKKEDEAKQKKEEEQKKKQKEEEEEYQNDYDEDFDEDIKKSQSVSKDKEVEEEYEENFEIQSNSFSIRSKQSIRSLKEDEDDNKAYTQQQTRKQSGPKQSSKISTPQTPFFETKPDSKPSATPVPSNKSIQKLPPARPISAQQNPVSGGQQELQKLAKVVKNIKSAAPLVKKDQAENKQAVPPKLTQHQLDQQKKKQEIQESEKKQQKLPKLPNLQGKALKVNNFIKENKDEKKKPELKKQDAKERKPKDELDEDIFGEDEKEKGDQAIAAQSNGVGEEEEESEETKKLKEKQRRQEILKEQKEKRKEQLDGQWDNVKQILKNHEDKQQELKDKEDQYYIREAVEKMKQKRVKQNLNYENEESNWVDITRKDHKGLEKEERFKQQDKFRDQMLKNLKNEEENLKKKKINEEAQSKVFSQTRVSTKTEIKEKQWDNHVAPKKGTLNEISKIESEKNEIVRENAVQLEMKQRERKKYLEQLEVEKNLKKKAQEFVKEGQDHLKGNNKALDNIDKILKENEKDKKEKQKERNYQHEEQEKEKQEQDAVEIKKLKIILRQLLDENKQVKSLLNIAKSKNTDNQTKIAGIKNSNGVVVLGDNKFTSFGLVPALHKKQDINDASTNDDESVNITDSIQSQNYSHLFYYTNMIFRIKQNSSEQSQINPLIFIQLDKISDNEKRQITQLTVIELIVHKITEQGLTLSDIFSLLDYNKDGILTIQEIEINMDMDKKRRNLLSNDNLRQISYFVRLKVFKTWFIVLNLIENYWLNYLCIYLVYKFKYEQENQILIQLKKKSKK